MSGMSNEPTPTEAPDLPGEIARLTSNVAEAHARLVSAEAKRDERKAELAQAQEAFGEHQRETIEARDAFDLDPSAKKRFLKAQEAERIAKTDLDRASRLSTIANNEAKAADAHWREARAELGFKLVSRENVNAELAPVDETLLAAHALLVKAAEQFADVRDLFKARLRELVDATGDIRLNQHCDNPKRGFTTDNEPKPSHLEYRPIFPELARSEFSRVVSQVFWRVMERRNG